MEEKYFTLEKDHLIHEGIEVCRMPIERVMHFDASMDHTRFTAACGGTGTIKKRLGTLLELLGKPWIYRHHDSHAVNMHYIYNILPQKPGVSNREIMLLDGKTTLDVSRRKFPEFEEAYTNFRQQHPVKPKSI